MNISNLVIEVTRICNLKCKHCLRGCAKNENFNVRYLDNIFHDVEFVDCLTFTGGEPLLKINTIKSIMNYIRNHKIGLGAFYIVHNGTIYSKSFMNFLLDFYENYCEDPYMCGFSLSTDLYHIEELKKKNKKDFYYEYMDLKEFGYEFIQDDRKEINSIILSGRAKRNKLSAKYGTRESSFNNAFYANDDECDNQIYISANGNVISDCDLSYDVVDKFYFGNIKKEYLSDIYNRNLKPIDDVYKINC